MGLLRMHIAKGHQPSSVVFSTGVPGPMEKLWVIIYICYFVKSWKARMWSAKPAPPVACISLPIPRGQLESRKRCGHPCVANPYCSQYGEQNCTREAGSGISHVRQSLLLTADDVWRTAFVLQNPLKLCTVPKMRPSNPGKETTCPDLVIKQWKCLQPHVIGTHVKYTKDLNWSTGPQHVTPYPGESLIKKNGRRTCRVLLCDKRIAQASEYACERLRRAHMKVQLMSEGFCPLQDGLSRYNHG